MKNWHVVAIAFTAGVVVCALCTPARAAADVRLDDEGHKVTCPAPTDFNTGWVVTDEDGDSVADHQYRVFNSGPCKSWPVTPDDEGELVMTEQGRPV